jgi:hypothetical protein
MRTSKTLEKIRTLASGGTLLVSSHGYDELASDGIFFSEILVGLADALVVEDYPDAAKGPSVLVLQRAADGSPVHIVWGIPRGADEPGVLVTAYRPDPKRWSADFLERRR